MEKQIAKQAILDTISVLQHAVRSIEGEESLRKYCNEQVEKINNQNSAINDLGQQLIKARAGEQLLAYYQRTLPALEKMDICPHCNGAGCFDYDTEEGPESEPCVFCDQEGIVPFADAERLRETQTRVPEPEQPFGAQKPPNAPSEELPF